MSWQQIRCRCQLSQQDAITQFFENSNASAISYEDAEDVPIFEPKPGETIVWESLVIVALYPEDEDLVPLKNFINSYFPNTQISIVPVEEQIWERVWMDDFQPCHFGNNLWIYPSWAEQPDDGSTQILLDPGLAFGTGTHPTTALCLEWLGQNPPANQTAIDFGCGSGILAIAASKLGATQVIATDIDEQALIATQNNMQTNSILCEKISTCYPNEVEPNTSVDLVLANILSEPLIELSVLLSHYCKPGGMILLSGILDTQTDAVYDAYAPWLDDIQITHKEEWICLSGKRNNSIM